MPECGGVGCRSVASGEGSCVCPGRGGWVIVPDMRASEIRQLIRMKPVELDTTRRRLGACHDIGDLRAMGRRLVPRPVFDYVDGGADEELSMAANMKAFRRWRFLPRALPRSPRWIPPRDCWSGICRSRWRWRRPGTRG